MKSLGITSPDVAFAIFRNNSRPGLRLPFRMRAIVEGGTPIFAAKMDGVMEC